MRTGSNGTAKEWLTSQAGTGKFEEYVFRLKCGSDGSFSSTNFYYLNGPAATASNPVTWYVALADVIDTGVTGVENSIIFTATDNVGVTGYGINQSSTTAPTYTNYNTPRTTVGGGKVGITSNGTYYIWARDEAGNAVKNSVSVNKVQRTFRVTFNANGGSVSPTSKTVTYGSTYGSLPSPSRTGHTFQGWYTAASGGTRIQSTSTVTTAANHTLYARWTVNNYTATFNSNGGSTASPQTIRRAYGSQLGTLPTTSRTGYTFQGWYTAASGGSKISTTTTMPAGGATYYAHWTINSYTATFNSNGGSTASPQTIRRAYGSQLGTLPTTSRTGYTFQGWYTAASGGSKISTTTTMPAGGATYYAHWTGNTYYVAYNGNGATGGSTATSTHRYGTASALRANGFVKNWPNGGGGTIRWSFRNWNRNAAGTSTSYSNRQSVTNLATSGTVTLYAQWTFNNATGVMGGSNDVNMRTGPGSGYANIGGSTWPTYAVRGANCTITNAAYQNYGSSGTLWLYVTCAARNLQVDTALGTKTGWVSGDYVRIN